MKPEGKPFDGLANAMRDSPWIASEDLDALDGAAKVTIEGCNHYDVVEFEEGRRRENVYTLRLKESKRELVLNGANRRTLVAQFGLKTSAWVGKQIELYVLENIRVGREMKRGIRIRMPKGEK